MAGCAPQQKQQPEDAAATTSVAADGTTACEYPSAGTPAKPVDPPQGKGVSASGPVLFTLNTSQGAVSFTGDRAKTPCTINALEALAKQQYFDNTQCHRLVDKGIFVLQCGDPAGTGRGGPGFKFADELTGRESYPAGTVAMANSGPNTNGSQFFLVYADSKLPAKYTVVGTMDRASIEVVARIAGEGQDGSNPDGSGKPNHDAKILQATSQSS